MAQKLRKMVMKRVALCDRVLSAARVQGPGLVVQLGEYLSPALNDGETLPDVGSLIELYARRLQGLGAWKR